MPAQPNDSFIRAVTNLLFGVQLHRCTPDGGLHSDCVCSPSRVQELVNTLQQSIGERLNAWDVQPQVPWLMSMRASLLMRQLQMTRRAYDLEFLISCPVFSFFLRQSTQLRQALQSALRISIRDDDDACLSYLNERLLSHGNCFTPDNLLASTDVAFRNLSSNGGGPVKTLGEWLCDMAS